MCQGRAYRIQHLLRGCNRHENRNPIARHGASNPVTSREAILSQPCVDSLQTKAIRSDELRDLFLQKMLAIAHVLRIADLVQLAFKFGKACLRESDAKPDALRGWCGAQVDPVGRRQYGLFQFSDVGG